MIAFPKAQMPDGPSRSFVDQLADEITAALMKRKRDMTIAGQAMYDRHVREEIRTVLAARVTAPTVVKSDEITPEERIFAEYPRRIGKKKALVAISAALGDKTYRELFEATRAFAAAVARWPATERLRFCPHPSTWFNRGSYEDDPKAWERTAPTTDTRDYSKGI